MNTCEHGDAVVVYLKGTCPLCAAKEEIEEHEKANSVLTEDNKSKSDQISELGIELANLESLYNNQPTQ
jgi:hypothetical protein